MIYSIWFLSTVKTNVSEITHIVFNMAHYDVKKRHPHIAQLLNSKCVNQYTKSKILTHNYVKIKRFILLKLTHFLSE